MQPMSQAAGRELRWAQPHFGRRWWELRALDAHGKTIDGDAGLFAMLGWKRRFHRVADIETADGAWRLSRPRLVSRDIRIEKTDEPGRVVTVRWTGLAWSRTAHIRLADDRAYKFWPSHFWSAEYAIAPEDSDEPLITFRRHFRPFRTENDVQIAASAARLPDLALLVSLGWYMRAVAIQRQRHAAMAT